MPNPFASANFNPLNGLQGYTTIFDASGIIDAGIVSNPAQLGYTVPWMSAYMQSILNQLDMGSVVPDVAAAYGGAQWQVGVSYAVTADGNTTYYIDNGFQGTSGQDVIFDMVGSDIANTGDGDDLIILGGGDNHIDAGSGADVVLTSVGNDVIKLGQGDDYARTWEGDDQVKAGGGHDTVIADGGADRVWGQGGRDTLDGGAGADMLHGGGGRDRLIGGADDDVLTGGNGRDTFVFHAGDGADSITDFGRGNDKVLLEMIPGFASWGDVQAGLSQVGGDVVLALSAADQIVFEGLSLVDLNASDFIFA